MAVGGAFDNRSLRTKIGLAVLIATVSGLIVGGLAINTVHRLNRDAAASQQQTLALETAVGSFSKNIEAFGGSVSALQLYPAIADAIVKGMEEEKTAITDALSRLKTPLAGDPACARTVAKAEQDWLAYQKFMSADTTNATAAEWNQLLQQYNTLY